MSPYVRPSGDKISQNLVSLRILNEIIFSFCNAIWAGNIDDSKEIAPKPISVIARRLIGSEVAVGGGYSLQSVSKKGPFWRYFY